MLRICKMYSIKPIQQNIRTEFELPSWVFYNGPHGPILPDCVEYLQGLGIIHFNCPSNPTSTGSRSPNSLMIPTSDGTVPDKLDMPFRAYRHLVALDMNKLSPYDIPESHRGMSNDAWLKIYGDFKWWLEYNVNVDIYGINDVKLTVKDAIKSKGRGLQNHESFRQ